MNNNIYVIIYNNAYNFIEIKVYTIIGKIV